MMAASWAEKLRMLPSKTANKLLLCFFLIGMMQSQSVLISAEQRREAAATTIQNCSITSQAQRFLSSSMIQGKDPLGLVGVRGISYSIGYTVIDEVKQTQTSNEACRVQLALIKNKFGTAVPATAAGAQAAVRGTNFNDKSQQACPGFGLCASIWDGSEKDVYPISTLTYLVVTISNDAASCPKMRLVYDYVNWILFSPDATAIATAVGFATMPKKVAELAKSQILDVMTCGSGSSLRYVKDEPVPSAGLIVKGSGSSLQAKLQSDMLKAYSGAGDAFVKVHLNSFSYLKLTSLLQESRPSSTTVRLDPAAGNASSRWGAPGAGTTARPRRRWPAPRGTRRMSTAWWRPCRARGRRLRGRTRSSGRRARRWSGRASA